MKYSVQVVNPSSEESFLKIKRKRKKRIPATFMPDLLLNNYL